MIRLFFVCADLRFNLVVTVICFELYIEIVSCISCILFDILLSAEVESWMGSDEGLLIDLNKLLLVSKSEAIVLFIFKLRTQNWILFFKKYEFSFQNVDSMTIFRFFTFISVVERS